MPRMSNCRSQNTVAWKAQDRLRFVKPVFNDDAIHGRLTVICKRNDPRRSADGRRQESTEGLCQSDGAVLAADRIHIVERMKRPS